MIKIKLIRSNQTVISNTLIQALIDREFNAITKTTYLTAMNDSSIPYKGKIIRTYNEITKTITNMFKKYAS